MKVDFLTIVFVTGDYPVSVRIHFLEALHLRRRVCVWWGVNYDCLGPIWYEETQSSEGEWLSTDPTKYHCSIFCELGHTKANHKCEAGNS